MSFEVAAKLDKPRFALDEAVPLAVAAVNLSGGLLSAPVIESEGGTVSLELRRGAGPVELFRPGRNLGGHGMAPPLIGRNQASRGVLDVKHLAGPLAAGRYEVAAVVELTGDRSKPVEFVVERAPLRAAVAMPVSGTGEDSRQVLRLEARGGGAELVLVRPGGGHDDAGREAIHLGPVPAAATIALSVSPPPLLDERAWAVALDGTRLVRRFTDRGLGAHSLPDVAVPANGARLVGALGGSLETPAPPPVFERGADFDPWPRLHVALLAGDAGTGVELLALDVGPGASSVPAWHRARLATAPSGARACALDGTLRYVFVASSAEADRVRIDATPWTAAGLGAPVRVLETRGALLDMETLVSPGGDEARVVCLLALSEPEGALVLESARIDARGAVVRLAPRLLLREQRPDDMEQPRLRLVWEEEAYLLARTAAGDPILVLPGTREPWAVPVRRDAWWDIEVAVGRVNALSVDEERGLVAEPLEPPDETP